MACHRALSRDLFPFWWAIFPDRSSSSRCICEADACLSNRHQQGSILWDHISRNHIVGTPSSPFDTRFEASQPSRGQRYSRKNTNIFSNHRYVTDATRGMAMSRSLHWSCVLLEVRHASVRVFLRKLRLLPTLHHFCRSNLELLIWRRDC